LEEYSVTKSNPDSKKRKTLISGRNDLYFKIGRANFILEAKQYWPNLRSKGVLIGLNKALKAAKKDVRTMKADGARRLAAVFVAGRIPENFKDDSEEILKSMIDALNSASGAARAWIFPENTDKLIDGKKTRKWYPGAALVIKEV